MIFKTPVSNRYLMFVGNDFKLRTYDITYHYEGIVTLAFEQALPTSFSESYDHCEGLTRLTMGSFFLKCTVEDELSYNITIVTSAEEYEESFLVKSMQREPMRYL